MKGYRTDFGYMGYIPEFNKYMLFSTEEEYISYMKE